MKQVYKLKFAGAKLQKDKARNNTSGYDIASLKLLKTHYWHRVSLRLKVMTRVLIFHLLLSSLLRLEDGSVMISFVR
jgi:hypothetical protein